MNTRTSNQLAVNPVRIGGVLRTARRRAGMRQIDVAVAIRSTRSVVGLVERGRRVAHLHTYAAMATVYGMPVADLFAVEGVS